MPTETVINRDALAALIAKDGITQSQLAETAQVSRQMLSDVLAGKRLPSAPMRKALATALRVPLSAIETLREVSA
jgi:transcriptional regulator with XRE-family HTH domain